MVKAVQTMANDMYCGLLLLMIEFYRPLKYSPLETWLLFFFVATFGTFMRAFEDFSLKELYAKYKN